MLIYLAAREAAHQRLFSHVPWLRERLLATVEEYARGITIDTSRIEEMARGIDPSDPAAMQEIMGSGMFEPETTPEQKAALARLETLLALVEGWVDTVVAEAAKRPAARGTRRCAETMRRRRASGGPAEQTFATLVGLQLRPRRLRDAADGVAPAMGQQHGSALTATASVGAPGPRCRRPTISTSRLDFVARDDLSDPIAEIDEARPRSSRRTTRSRTPADAPDGDEPDGDGPTEPGLAPSGVISGT